MLSSVARWRSRKPTASLFRKRNSRSVPVKRLLDSGENVAFSRVFTVATDFILVSNDVCRGQRVTLLTDNSARHTWYCHLFYDVRDGQADARQWPWHSQQPSRHYYWRNGVWYSQLDFGKCSCLYLHSITSTDDSHQTYPLDVAKTVYQKAHLTHPASKVIPVPRVQWFKRSTYNGSFHIISRIYHITDVDQALQSPVHALLASTWSFSSSSRSSRRILMVCTSTTQTTMMSSSAIISLHFNTARGGVFGYDTTWS